MLNWNHVEVGDVYYRKIDDCMCGIKGFFYLHYDGTMSTVVDNYKLLRKSIIKYDLVPDNIHVLFHNDTFDTVENLFTNLYMTKVEYDKLQEHIQKMENADGLYSAMQIALDFPTITPHWKQVFQEILDEQPTEAYWNDDDLVPNPGEKPKR